MAIEEISVQDLNDCLEGDFRLIDVREPQEFEECRAPAAQLVPLGTVPENTTAFVGDGPTYVICRSGGRSMNACEFLADQGIEAINVAGGTLAWVAAGHDIATGTQ